MMQIDTKDLEKLSAYIDNELTPVEKNYIENKLQQSPTLRQELLSLKATRESVNAIAPLPEDPYFETRLMQKLSVRKSVFSSFFSNRKPILALASVTLIFLIVFKVQPNLFHEVLENNKASLEAFYAKNLMPLISATNLTNDDVFNFAFNKYLPINKENRQGISIEKNAKGEQVIEVKNAGMAGMPLNVESWAKNMGLTQTQKKGVYKILENYSDKIASAVLVDDKNGVAVSASLWGLHNQLQKDLLDYFSNANSAAFNQMIKDGADEMELYSKQVQNLSKTSLASSDYYYFSPDTFFHAELPVDIQKIDKTIQEVRFAEAALEVNSPEKDVQKHTVMKVQAAISKEMKKVSIDMKQLARAAGAIANSAREMQVYANDENCRMVISKAVAGSKIEAEAELAEKILNKTFSSLKVYANAYTNDEKAPIPLPEPAYKKYGNPVTVSGGSRTTPSVPDRPDPDTIAKKYNLHFDNSGDFLKNKKKQSGASVIAVDSLQKLLSFYIGELKNSKSSGNGLDELRNDIQKLHRELEKLSKEMQLKKSSKDTIIEAKNIMEL